MSLALAEAEKGVGRTAPNPPVGAVITKNNQLIGSGWHRAAGCPHAEREAIADAIARHGKECLRGATIHVTLEPCSTHGRTPPCTQGIIDAGITRVVYACRDENPAHQGRADALLKSAGITVESGVGEASAQRILRPFFKVRRHGVPWIIWKTAMSIDGRLTRPPGEGQWLTRPETRLDVQNIRSKVDAILTSGETVRRDRPALTIREPDLLAGRPQPWRVVFSDRPDSLPADAPLMRDLQRTRIMPRSGIRDSLRRLAAENGVLSAMVESGGVFAAALLEAGWIDEVVIYLAPMLTGGPVPALADPPLPAPFKLDEIQFHQIPGTSDIRLRGLVAKKM